MPTTGNILVALGLAALTGGMLFFGAVMAPLVFTKLPAEAAGNFIRAAFPFYYAYIIATSALAAGGFLLRSQYGAASALFALMAVTVWLLFGWMPHLEAMRLAGDTAGFARGHRISVWINGAQLLTALALLVRNA
ncbi:DUF4149 domain-containing protein [Acidocella sp.]|uniref:DUF4149 domain-containing protein n=1 Tax=Acidocella sp. TaxID=50710 RepID=UPI0018111052|nr:DUF4149 domain-containing protein [Acidocella sp.]MDD2794505.1 DUF4149 domain-containing protein [Acidocella sp.]NNM56629.1 DUF4149 domain-containing protein [Acidocella sp.]